MIIVRRKNFFIIIFSLLMVFGSFYLFFNSLNILQHNCRLWAGFSEKGLPQDLLENDLVSAQFSLKNLSTSNPNGWGLAAYFSVKQPLKTSRGFLTAKDDPNFDSAVRELGQQDSKIILAHVRVASSGCHGPTVNDPHPFSRQLAGRTWTFMHNGSINKKALINLIGQDYLVKNPPNCSQVTGCLQCTQDQWVDSELYFLYLIKHIQQNNGQVDSGLLKALNLLESEQPNDKKNFILSDGINMWAYKSGYSLYYHEDQAGDYFTVASQPPSANQLGWQPLENYQLIKFTSKEKPSLITVTGNGKYNQLSDLELENILNQASIKENKIILVNLLLRLFLFLLL